MAFAKVATYADLEIAIARVKTAKWTAKRLFEGFVIPPAVEEKFEKADSVLDQWGVVDDPQESQALIASAILAHQEAQRHLESVLVGFFRKSGNYFSAKLKAMKLDADFLPRVYAIQDRVRKIDAMGKEKWVNLKEAGNLYFAVANSIKDLEEAQRRRIAQRIRARIIHDARQPLGRTGDLLTRLAAAGTR